MPRGNNNKTRRYTREQELRRNIIVPMMMRCKTEDEIRKEVMARLGLETYSRSTVHKDIVAIRAEMTERRFDTEDKIEETVQVEVARLRLVAEEAWDAWERSKDDKTTTKSKRKGLPPPEEDPDGKITTLLITEERVKNAGNGDPRYLDIVLKSYERIHKLLGLDKMNVNLSGNVGGSFEIKHTKTGFTPATSEDEVRRREGLDE